MLEVFTRLIANIMMSTYGFIIINKITQKEEKLFKCKNILLIILLSIITLLLHKTEYKSIYTIIIFMLNIIIYKNIFNLKVEESLVSSGILMFLMFVGDMSVAFIFRNFLTFKDIRQTGYIYIITTFLVALVGIVITNIKFIIQQFQNFYFYISRKRSISNFFFLFSLMIALSIFTQNVSVTIELSTEYFANIIVMVTLVIIAYLFIKSKNSYNELSLQFDSLFSYVQNFEDWIEKEQLNRHEYKNQLAVLRCLTKERKVKAKIDEILEDNINVEGPVVNQLKGLPKGGIKGLMYYKAAIAQKNKINLTVNVSLETNSILTTLSENDIRVLCKLIGIYFDNAIEAAKETKKKDVLVEIYEFKDRVNIVFSNTFKKHKNFSDRNKKGVSTKGEGHGNGLYFASNLIAKNSWLSEKQEVIDKYYIQQLSIHKKNISSK